MKTIILYTFFLFISSCKLKLDEDTVRKYVVDGRASSVVDEFYSLGQSKGLSIDRNLELYFSSNDSNLKNGVVGYCTVWENDRLPPRIIISASFWNGATPLERKMLIYHELGHCLLKRGHKESTVRVGHLNHPISIMYPIISSYGSQSYNFMNTNFSLYENELYDRNLGYVFASFGTITGNVALKDEGSNEDDDSYDNLDDMKTFFFKVNGKCDHD